VARLSIRTRSVSSVVLVVLGAVLLFVGVIALYAREEIIDREAFADRAVAALDDDGLRHLVSREIVVNLVDRGSTDLVAARPLLESVVDAVVQTQPFRQVFRRAAVETNKVFFVREKSDALVNLGDAATVVGFAVQSVSPKLARDIPNDINPDIFNLDRDQFAGETLAIADQLRLFGLLLPISALLLFVAAIALSPDRRVAVLRVGVGVAAAGTLLAIALLILKARVLAGVVGEDEVTDQEVRDAVSGLIDAYLGDLVGWGLLLGLLGVVLAGAAAALDPGDVEAPTRRLVRLLERPASIRGQVLRGVAALLLGIWIVLQPTLALQVAAIAGGAYLVFFGVTELLVLIGRRDRPEAATEAGRRQALAIAGGVGVAAVAALLVVVVALTGAGGESRSASAAVPSEGCNGSRELCDRPLNEVTFAGTHNSFSAADSPGWFIANQRHTIPRQLKDGIRLFLIDPHWGIELPNGHVLTDFHDESRDRNKVAKAMPPNVLAAAERLVGHQLGGDRSDGTPDVWLCHTVCELGATKMVDSLEQIREFLEANRGEVVILFIEPYVKPAEIAKRFEQAGLEKYVATLYRDAPLPTLGKLVDSNKRVIVFAEKDADGTVPWYLDGFSYVQDTPLGATTTNQLSCARERGDADSPLLMLNHWADVFPPQLRANRPFLTTRFLLRRARQCERRRGMPVNMIAVDFYDQGKLIEAVKRLNDKRGG
jgi:uncharacterized membrane protein HdeD (DUF308 family)